MKKKNKLMTEEEMQNKAGELTITYNLGLIDLSIKKWERIIKFLKGKPKEEDWKPVAYDYDNSSTCALCYAYDDDCSSCIFVKHCAPIWIHWAECDDSNLKGKTKAAKGMLDALKKLRSKLKRNKI